jgi:hypothetical protein
MHPGARRLSDDQEFRRCTGAQYRPRPERQIGAEPAASHFREQVA